jgi:hypothetical protein
MRHVPVLVSSLMSLDESTNRTTALVGVLVLTTRALTQTSSSPSLRFRFLLEECVDCVADKGINRWSPVATDALCRQGSI